MGTRESIQALVGGVVNQLRDQIAEGVIPEPETDAAIEFHDRAERLWRDLMSTDPPTSPDEIVTRLYALRMDAKGSLEGFRVQLDEALKKVKLFMNVREHR